MGNEALGRKQRISNDAWIEAMTNIEKSVPKKDLDSKVRQTVKNIKEKTDGKNVAYGWSAGKDSIVLGKICEKAGIKKCVLAVCNLEYPAFEAWAKENAPEGLTIVNTGQDIEWLKSHPEMLFPKDAKTAATWFKIVQHRAQENYFRENNLDMILLGRRRADGNYVGRGSNTYTNARGITRFSPLADWTHEEILAYIHYYKLPVPPIYGWEKGYLCGTHPWPARQYMKTEEQGWKEVYEIDKSIVQEAAKHLEGAKRFFDSIK